MLHPNTIEELCNLFEWNYPRLFHLKDAKKLCPPLVVPFEGFYDKHVDERLTLRRIVRLPSLIHDLAANAQDGLQSILSTDSAKASKLASLAFDRQLRFGYYSQRGMIDAISVADFYTETTASACLGLASTILQLPQLSNGDPCLAWGPVEHRSFPLYLAFRDDLTLAVASTLDATALLTDDQHPLLRKLWRRFLGTWQILPFWQQSEDLILSVCDFEGERAFDHQQAGTTGLPTPPLRDLPPDALIPRCSIPHRKGHVPYGIPRRSSRLAKCAVSQSNGGFITVSPIKTKQISRSDAFIQRAWCKAVRDDCTFIVFTCGSLELIGIRHRATQTLYLSDPIDVHYENPTYGLIHLGLYIAMFEDVKDRLQQTKVAKQIFKVESEESTTATLDLQITPDISNSGTRLARQNKEGVLQEASRRSILLLKFRYAHYNSRSPSAFKRIASSLVPGLESTVVNLAKDFSRCGYDPGEYISVTVSAYIGAGTTGAAHRAILEMLLPDGSVYSYDAVLKFANENYQRRKLLKEYAIYTHLAQAKVTGIPTILGLFEGVEECSSGPLLMIMDDCGTSLHFRQTTTDSERRCFEKTLNTIHNAGVIHGDIRPTNLLVDEAGQTTIIDFDCARVMESSDAKFEKLKEDEIGRLKSIFTESEFEWHGLSPSPRTTPPHHWYSDEGSVYSV